MAMASNARHAPSDDRPIVNFSKVSLNYGQKPILSGIDLQISRGEFISVVGTSGCGKTTMLRLLSGLVPTTTGEIQLNGEVLRAPRRDVAVVFQDYSRALLPWRTVAGNVSLALEATNYPKQQRAGRIEELLTLTGLARHADKYPGQLSGGMQQRLQIARCLAQEPALLLMDEPFGALDAMTRQTLQDELLAILSRTTATAFFVTHDLEEAVYLSDRIICMKPHPIGIAKIMDVQLAQPRNQLTTREDPAFLAMRHELYAFMEGHG